MKTSYSIDLLIALFTTQWNVIFPSTRSTRSRLRTLTGCGGYGSTRRSWRSRGFEVTTTSSAPQPDPERPWRPLTSSSITSEDLGNYHTQSESQLYLEFGKYQVTAFGGGLVVRSPGSVKALNQSTHNSLGTRSGSHFLFF